MKKLHLFQVTNLKETKEAGLKAIDSLKKSKGRIWTT